MNCSSLIIFSTKTLVLDYLLNEFYTELILIEGQTRDGNNNIYEAYMPYSSISKAYKLIFKLDTRSQALQTLGDNFPIY